MKLKILHTATVLGLALIWGQVSCRSAIYEIIKPNKDRREQGDPIGPLDVENAGPTAAIEVIKDGRYVTKVRVQEPTQIRPTADTVDPDDIGKSQCPNPGIFRAQYQIGTEASPEVNRGAACDELGVPYSFKTPGDYLITMTVTTEEGETAIASMTLHVVAANAPLDEDGGFMIKANPLIVGIGQEVNLNGICTTKKAHTISWQYGDGETGEGASTKHAYGKKGSYRIEAVCRETVSGGSSWNASVTVVVMDKPVTPPSSNTPPGTNHPGGGGGEDVGQNGQNGQHKPGQIPASPSLPGPVPAPGAPKRCHILFFSWSC